MDKVSFTNLKLKMNNETKSFDFNGQKIEVFQYVSITDKDDMIQSIIQNSVNRGIYNPIKADMYFHLYLVYLYTNITFTKKQKEDEEKLYDMILSSGLLEQILKVIPQEEYAELKNFFDAKLSTVLTYETSTARSLTAFIEELPKQMAEAAKIVDNFDKEKYSNVIDFAKAANGGRDINTNE